MKAQILDLQKKKKQVENLALQFRLNTKLEETRSDMGQINDQLGGVNFKITKLKQQKDEAMSVVRGLEEQLKKLRAAALAQ